VPLLRHLRDELNGWLAPMFGDDLEVDIDLDDVPALALRREKVWRRLQSAEFLTVNEKRRSAGFGLLPGGDRLAPRRTDRRAGSPG
jgi:phage portal protein BeeE